MKTYKIAVLVTCLTWANSAKAQEIHLLCPGNYTFHIPDTEVKPHQYTVDISGEDITVNWPSMNLKILENSETRIVAARLVKSQFTHHYIELILNRYSGEGKIVEYSASPSWLEKFGVFRTVSGIDFAPSRTHRMVCKPSKQMF